PARTHPNSSPTRRSSDLMLLADMRQNLIKGDRALEERLMLDRWVYQPGIPPNMVRPPAGTFVEQDKAAAAFAAGGAPPQAWGRRSEEHTSELQSPYDVVC